MDGLNTNISNVSFGTTVTSGTYNITNVKKVCDIKLVENEEGNFIEVISCFEPGLSLYVNSSKSYTKERYGVIDGKITLIKTISGTEKPAYLVRPDIEWAE